MEKKAYTAPRSHSIGQVLPRTSRANPPRCARPPHICRGAGSVVRFHRDDTIPGAAGCRWHRVADKDEACAKSAIEKVGPRSQIGDASRFSINSPPRQRGSQGGLHRIRTAHLFPLDSRWPFAHSGSPLGERPSSPAQKKNKDLTLPIVSSAHGANRRLHQPSPRRLNMLSVACSRPQRRVLVAMRATYRPAHNVINAKLDFPGHYGSPQCKRRPSCCELA